MAVSAIAADVTMTELRVTGASGGISTSFGRRSGALAANHLVAHRPPASPTTAISTPTTIMPQGRRMPRPPSGVSIQPYSRPDRIATAGRIEFTGGVAWLAARSSLQLAQARNYAAAGHRGSATLHFCSVMVQRTPSSRVDGR